MKPYTICGHFHRIEYLVDEIYTRAKTTGQDTNPAILQDVITDILNYVQDIKNTAEDMRDCGQRMEDRLRDYRNAIQALGYTRNKVDK